MEVTIGDKTIHTRKPVFIIVELSTNDNQSFDEAAKIIYAAKECGADAVKLQTYTPDTITMDSDKEYSKFKTTTIWDGEELYDLYGKAYTPLEWQPKLKTLVDGRGVYRAVKEMKSNMEGTC